MKGNKILDRAGCLLVAAVIPLTSTAEVTSSQAMEEVEELRRLIEAQRQQQMAQQRLLEKQAQELQAQQRALERLRRQLATAASVSASNPATTQPIAQDQSRGSETLNSIAPQDLASAEPMRISDARGGQRGAATGAEQAGQQTRRQASQPEQVGESPEERERTSDSLSVADVIRDQSILTPKGTFVFTPSFAYTNDSNVRTAVTGFSIFPAILIGAFDVRKINRNTFVTTLTGRYGLTRKADLEFKVPYVYRSDSVRARRLGVGEAEDTRFTADGGDIGDIEAALRYQFQRPGPDWPFITGGLRIKSNTGESPYDVEIDPASTLPSGDMPTGSGFWGIKPSVSFMYPSDPVVYFSELSYQWNLERDVGGDFGKVDPGDFIGVDFGMGFALNESASFTLGYQHRTVLKTEQQGRQVGDTLQVASLITSFAYKYTKNASVNLSIAGGLTDDSPDVQVTLSLPISFDL